MHSRATMAINHRQPRATVEIPISKCRGAGRSQKRKRSTNETAKFVVVRTLELIEHCRSMKQH